MCKKEKISINRNSADARCFALICDCISRLHYPGDKRYTKRYCCHIQWAVENYYHLSESPPLTPKPNFSFEVAQYEHPKIKLYTVGNFKAPQKGVLFSSSAHVFFAFHFDIVGRHGIPKCIPWWSQSWNVAQEYASVRNREEAHHRHYWHCEPSDCRFSLVQRRSGCDHYVWAHINLGHERSDEHVPVVLRLLLVKIHI